MLPAPQNAMDKVKQEEYYRYLIKNAFKIVDMQNEGYVDRKEISYIMRYLLKFPSEMQIRDYIIDQLEGDTPTDYIKYDKFEPFMVNVMMSNEYDPAPAEMLLKAFQVLDP